MRYLITLITVALLSGCVTMTPENAKMATPHELCQAYVHQPPYSKGSQRVAYQELQRRNLSCDMQYYGALRQDKLDRLRQPLPENNNKTVVCNPLGTSVVCRERSY